MRKKDLRTYFAITLVILFLVFACIAKDIIMSKLMASVAIITGAYTFHNLSNQNKIRNEESTNI